MRHVLVCCVVSALGCSNQLSGPSSAQQLAAPLTATEEPTLLSANGGAQNRFGAAVALSADGQLAAVGGPYDLADAGAVRTFTRSVGVWTERTPIIAFDFAPYDRFGASVALSLDGTRAMVGAPDDDTVRGINAGSARGFLRTGQGWLDDSPLIPNDGAADDGFGTSVAINADSSRALIGAPNDDTAAGTNAGTAHYFTRSGTVWTDDSTLSALGGAANDGFGTAVALSADGGIALVGAPFDDTTAGANTGTARVYVRTGAGWSEQAVLQPADAEADDLFGSAVALSADGTRALIGAPGDDVGTIAGVGSARVFIRTGVLWAEEATLADDAGVPGFGSAVALRADGRRALVGSSNGSGTARVFSQGGGTWAGDARLAPALSSTADQFGAAVALSADGNQALVGAPGYDRGALTNAGSATSFAMSGLAQGQACTTASQCGTGFCSDGVCCNEVCFSGTVTDCQSCLGAQTGGVDGVCGVVLPDTICRPSQGNCDYAEVCDGRSAFCPGNMLLPANALCRSLAGPCDLEERCTGISPTCPSDTVRTMGTVCRPSFAPCDLADTCDGTATDCPDRFQPPDTICAPAGGEPCDAPDLCTGTSAYCRPTYLSGVECRSGVGACDRTEYCSGSSTLCPPDQVVQAGIVCLASGTTCNQTASCDGVVGTCPPASGPCPGASCSVAGTDVSLAALLMLLLARRTRRSR